MRNGIDGLPDVQIDRVDLLSILVRLVKKVHVEQELLQSGSLANKAKLRVGNDGTNGKTTHFVINQTLLHLIATFQSKEMGR